METSSEQTWEALERGLERNPYDNTLRLVYADWLEEQGRDRDAREQRGLVKEPRFDRGTMSWDWWSEQATVWEMEEGWPTHLLPAPVFRALAGYTRSSLESGSAGQWDGPAFWKGYETKELAVLALHQAWQRVRVDLKKVENAECYDPKEYE